MGVLLGRELERQRLADRLKMVGTRRSDDDPRELGHADEPCERQACRRHAARGRLGLECLERGVSVAGLALAWLLGVAEVTAVVIGPTTADQLTPVREALSLELATEEHTHLRGLFP